MLFHFPAALVAAAAALSLAAGTAMAVPAAPASTELVVLVDTATDMPMSRFEHHRLVDGVHKDVGDALGAALGRKVRFLALPRKRITLALESGEADVLCGYMPAWLPGQFSWSQPFMTQVEVVLTDRGAVRPPVVGALASQPIGTVFGYSYPHLEGELGAAFVRADGPSVDLNMAKLAAGRLHHVSALQHWFDYRQRRGAVKVPLHPPLVVATHHTRCALSLRSQLSQRELDRALEKLMANGTIGAIEARYRSVD
ncbi:MAG: transporter substrate-binding protein [Massilia sp.]|nr:transporter substrate-binding protein [Massilia sp.]